MCISTGILLLMLVVRFAACRIKRVHFSLSIRTLLKMKCRTVNVVLVGFKQRSYSFILYWTEPFIHDCGCRQTGVTALAGWIAQTSNRVSGIQIILQYQVVCTLWYKLHTPHPWLQHTRRRRFPLRPLSHSPAWGQRRCPPRSPPDTQPKEIKHTRDI